MQDVMKDLETLGTRAGCAIVSIGAVAFDEFAVEQGGFYRSIKIPDWDVAGLTPEGLRKEQGTIDWWKKQSDEARKVLTDPDAVSLREALTLFGAWLETYRGCRVWGNGADFDLPILGGCYGALSLPIPWKPYNGRCYRTVKNQFPDIKLKREGTHHNALDDARSQADHLTRICINRGWRLA